MASLSAIPGAAPHSPCLLQGKNHGEDDDPLPNHEMYSTRTPVVTPFKGEAPTLTISPSDMEEQVLSDLEKSPRSPNLRKQSMRRKNSDDEEGTAGEPYPPEESARAVPNEADDDEDSSADDSSYFADPNHLPKPKSGAGRQFSYGSQPQTPPPMPHQQHIRHESNASLSLSDDSAEVGHILTAHAAAATILPQGGVPDMYPQQLTRMHSYSSLVSTSSQPDDDDDESYTNRPKSTQRYTTKDATTICTTNPVHYPYQTDTVTMRNPAIHAGSNFPRNNNNYSAGGQPYQGASYAPPPPPPPHMMMTPEQYQWAIITQQQQQLQQQQLYHHHPLQRPEHSLLSPSSKDSELAYSVESDHQHPRHATKRNENDTNKDEGDDDEEKPAFKVYWQRWIMLMYMSLLNLLSDWTCYSVAPIALLTEEAFGEINAEQLVVVFLGANVIATACEPIILSRLGLRRTVLFGALLLMMGSIVKSGGMPPIIQSSLHKGKGEWRVYVGFFLVGLSQPLYQCTPALLSASWFPEEERTMATSVALNANQLGIGFAFIFGTLLVANSDDIPHYFGLLSLISTLTFLGALLQFDDAPPTPPSDTARVMRGTLEVKLPTVQNILDSVRENFDKRSSKSATTTTRRKSRSSHRKKHPDNTHRRRRREQPQAPSSAPWDDSIVSAAPSPMMPGTVGTGEDINDTPRGGPEPPSPQHPFVPYPEVPAYPPYAMYGPPQPLPYPQYPPYVPAPPQWADPRNHIQAFPRYPTDAYPRYPPPDAYPRYPPPDPYFQYYSYQHGILPPPPHIRGYAPSHNVLPMAGGIDEGAEPVITITPHHCDIEIRDDQIILSTKACLARPGFIHSLVSFTVSGIVINTLSTFMDYLVRLNGASRAYTGIVGGAFQFCIMISSLIIGRVCDTTRAYYSITIGMLVLGAFGLAECGVSLDSNSGSTLRYALVVVAILVGPLQPVSTELGVDVVYPLSENTVLVIQQLFSNLLSAAFIPCFKAMKDFGAVGIEDAATERPQFTFSFYLLIVLHAAATVFFATFNGRYLRYEHELEKKAKEERRRQRRQAKAFRQVNHERHQSLGSARSDHLPPPPFM